MHSAQFQWKVLVQLGANISSLRDERLPKGPRFACESLDADTANGSAFSNWPTTRWNNALLRSSAWH